MFESLDIYHTLLFESLSENLNDTRILCVFINKNLLISEQVVLERVNNRSWKDNMLLSH